MRSAAATAPTKGTAMDAGKLVTAALVAVHVSIASVLFDKPFLVVLDLRGFFWCEVRPKLRGWTRVRKGMQVDRVEIVCGPAEAAFHGPKKLRRCEVPPGRVRIEAAQGQSRFIIPATEVGIEGPLDQSGLETAALQPLAARARLVAGLAGAEKKTGFDIFVFDLVEVVQEEFHFLGIRIRKRC